VASWARYAEGVGEDGQTIEVVDPLKNQLVPIAQRQREQPLAFIENRELFGDLVDDERFVDPYRETLQRLHTDGAEATLEWILHSCNE
jgi:mannitol 2-dehydrogenase